MKKLSVCVCKGQNHQAGREIANHSNLQFITVIAVWAQKMWKLIKSQKSATQKYAH